MNDYIKISLFFTDTFGGKKENMLFVKFVAFYSQVGF